MLLESLFKILTEWLSTFTLSQMGSSPLDKVALPLLWTLLSKDHFLLVLKSASIRLIPIDLDSAFRAPNQVYPLFLSIAL